MRNLIGFYFQNDEDGNNEIQYFRLIGDVQPACLAVDEFSDEWADLIDEYESRCNVIDQFSSNADEELISMEVSLMAPNDQVELVNAVRTFLAELDIEMVPEPAPSWSDPRNDF